MKQYKISEISLSQFESALENSISIGNVMQKLGWDNRQSNYRDIHFLASKFDRELPKWNNRKAGKSLSKTNRIPDNQFFAKGTIREGRDITKRLLKFGWKYLCSASKCPLGKELVWCDTEISLQVDHIDGDRHNNTLENLRFLCPNCHSQTPTFGPKNKKRLEDCECGRRKAMGTVDCPHMELEDFTPLRCKDCSKKVYRGSIRCAVCDKKNRSEGGRGTLHTYPSIETIIANVEVKGFLAYSKEIGISDNGLRKHLRTNGVTVLPRKKPSKSAKI